MTRRRDLSIIYRFLLHFPLICQLSNSFQNAAVSQRNIIRIINHVDQNSSRSTATNTKLSMLHGLEDVFQSTTEILSAKSMGFDLNSPFQSVESQLRNALDIGVGFGRNMESEIPEEATREVLGSLGSDILIFLAASLVVTTVANALNVTPILGYLIIGACLGPNGIDIFSNAQAGAELGDFGILFLLFSEGLEVTRSRLKKLTNFLPLGMAQISLTTLMITIFFLLLGKFAPMDTGFMDINDPIEACILAITCALSTSAFIFPVLKERGWEEESSGEAATTILLLQDLLVAPLLVILPYVAGSGPTDYAAIGFLTTKATIGFGAVILAGSYFLRRIFRLISQTRSSETFVALCLLVSAGMGEIAKSLGLTDTAGAFAAGVLLANTNYRAQIQADILPFKGILLGIFFMDAGSNFDWRLVLNQWPTVIGGSFALICIKAFTIAGATRIPKRFEPNRLSTVDAIRVSVLLAGGGEFAFVVLALADQLEILSKDLIGLLTAIVLVTMGITPLLGDLAETISQPFAFAAAAEKSRESVEKVASALKGSNGELKTSVAEDSIVILGHAEVGRSVLRMISDYKLSTEDESDVPNVVAFSKNPDLVESILSPCAQSIVLYGDGNNPEVIRSSGIENPKAIFITYQEHSRVIAATARLHVAFPSSPIFVRAATRRESRSLQLAGATEVIVEADELARAVPQLLIGTWNGPLNDSDYDSAEDFRVAAAAAAGISMTVVDDLFELYESLDVCATGLLGRSEVIEMFRKTKKGFIASDEEISAMERWLTTTTAAHMDPMDKIEFCRLYARAPTFVKDSFGAIRDAK